MTGAVVGTPGTLPTNWVEILAGLTREVVATGSENGINYVDLRFHGTSSGTDVILAFESVTQIVASNAQVWTESVWLKFVANSLPPTSSALNISERTSVGDFVAAGFSASLAITSSFNRFEFTRTLSGGATVARVVPRLAFGISNATAYDFTLRIGWPQMETGSVATSPIVTTAGTASRVADVVSLTGASSLIGQSAGSIFVEYIYPTLTADSVIRRLLSLNDGTTSNMINMGAFGSSFDSVVTTGGVAQTGQSFTPTPNIVNRLALGYELNNVVTCSNGTLTSVDTSATIPATSQINIGNRNGTQVFLGWIRSVAIFPTRLANATLQSLTS
jgi:hypothetical protein